MNIMQEEMWILCFLLMNCEIVLA